MCVANYVHVNVYRYGLVDVYGRVWLKKWNEVNLEYIIFLEVELHEKYKIFSVAKVGIHAYTLLSSLVFWQVCQIGFIPEPRQTADLYTFSFTRGLVYFLCRTGAAPSQLSLTAMIRLTNGSSSLYLAIPWPVFSYSIWKPTLFKNITSFFVLTYLL